MNHFASDTEVIQKILVHAQAGTTDRSDRVWREPTVNYRSAERLQAELQLLRARLLIFCPVAALPKRGSYLAQTTAGIPLVGVRDENDKIRVFRNACRHRGAQLVAGSGCKHALVCPYHAWAYRLDGRLQNIPHEDGFPGVDKAALGLVEVSAIERHGLVFVQLVGTPPMPDSVELLADVIGDEQLLVEREEKTLAVNWKIYLEGFLEGYHIKPTHRESFFRYGYDNLNIVEHSGVHSRVTFPFRRIEKLSDVPVDQWRVDGKLTYVYHFFPNVVVTVLSRHTNIIILEPIGVAETRVMTYQLADHESSSEAAELANRDVEFVSAGAEEDLAVVTAIQRSLPAEANEYFIFGQFEGALSHFHANLTRQIQGFESSNP